MSFASDDDSATLPYCCWNIRSTFWTSKAMFCAWPRSCWVRWTFC